MKTCHCCTATPVFSVRYVKNNWEVEEFACWEGHPGPDSHASKLLTRTKGFATRLVDFANPASYTDEA